VSYDHTAGLSLRERNHSEIFRRKGDVIAARRNSFQILVSNLPADSIHSRGGSGDWGQVRLFELEYQS